jgi:hypothetical protein
MSSAFLDQIDWSQPWLRPVLPAAERVLQGSDWRGGLNAAARDLGLQNHRSLPISFVSQSDLPAGIAYETFISESSGVPTRDNLHDFFNALVWLTYPKIKAQLNALQAEEIARREVAAQFAPSSRGRLRDAATIFDENAVVLLTSNAAIGDMLRQHAWQRLFIEQRKQFEQDCKVYLFGHALMEKLVSPYKAITGHTWVVEAEAAILALPDKEIQTWLDAKVSEQLQGGLNTAAFRHLPVLGVPGWWPVQDEDFYADRAVFRPARQPTGSG